jgi:frataxin-like iron-binding protein CyaY
MKQFKELIINLENKPNNNLNEQQLALIEESISKLILHIKSTETIEESIVYFELLDRIQYILARHHFKYDVNLSNKLKGFVKAFDRLDDEYMRLYLFNEIKKGLFI